MYSGKWDALELFDVNGAAVGGEGDGVSVALLLGCAGDLQVAGVVGVDACALLEEEAVVLREPGVADAVLVAGGGGVAEGCGPPAFASGEADAAGRGRCIRCAIKG